MGELRLKQNIDPIEKPRIIYGHGINGFDSCLYCDQEINCDNPGKMVIMGNRQEHLCNSCFVDPDYQEVIAPYNPIVKEYNF